MQSAKDKVVLVTSYTRRRNGRKELVRKHIRRLPR